jgi:predicted ABC-type ATPase
MPEIRIIAGTNGSGKTTFTDILSKEEAVLFNFNLATENALIKYPELKNSIKEFIKAQLNYSVEYAIEQKKDLTIVSNYNNEQKNLIDDILNEVKNKGYSTKLIYLHLNTIEDSMLRVKYREAEGGREVLPEIIKQNYTEAPINIKTAQRIFDSIEILDNSIKKEIPKHIIEIQKDRLVASDLDEDNKIEVGNMIEQFVGYGQKRKL